MAKFKYAFEKILRHKKLSEEQARRDFGEVQMKLAEQQAFLNNLEIDLKNSYNDKHKLQTRGGMVASSLLFFDDYYKLQIKMIENQKTIILGLKRILEEKRLRLVETAKEHKTFEKLKEKKKLEFKKEQNKIEQANIDEMNIMRMARGL